MQKKILTILALICWLEHSYAQTFTESALPIVVVDTDGDEIPDEPKIDGTMGIIYNGPGQINQLSDPFNAYDGNIAIETRGNSTQGFEKKTYSLETRDAANEDMSVSLLGMGADEDWILHAMVIDKTQLRIPMSFYLAPRMGHYASNWRYVELVVNGDYRGLYILCEKIKRDDDRVDIAKLDSDDLAGDSLTGGYILRIDWLEDLNPSQYMQSDYESQSGDPMTYQWYYPKAENILPQQRDYITDYMGEFEDAVFGPNYTNNQQIRYTDYIDINSFTDFLIINELSKNADGYKLSSYLHKDKDSKGGKLTAGPIWDFDQTYGVSLVCSNDNPSGWTYLQNQDGCEDLESMPLWWQSMMNDTIFTNHLRCRWGEFREGPLHQDSLFQWMDQYTTTLDASLNRNFQRWDFIGEYIWIEPDPVPETYEEEISVMKNWIENRLNWLDANMPGNCEFDIVSVDEESLTKETISLYPNPTEDVIWLTPSSTEPWELYNMSGQLLQTGSNDSISMGTFGSGVYFVRRSNQTIRVIVL